ncbi:universal stress protein [Natrarchaeobaculum aegyptiacum]|uniref:Universal stress protein n=1 Tax=Natrarchaeobaculum aegyptiacum TaxID=745377 RepID=A0A2Z2HYS3_9EURY|nr:universal stress protein [Natrarchaeobaculum aegyptiacum]ARS90987.1 universal stress protein [Natrarchaeobaculum aegyptiacum]
MTFVVPYDGSPLADAALERAAAFGAALDEQVSVVSVVPERTRYAREKGWIDEDEPYDVDAVVEDLRTRALSIAADAAFAVERIREFPPGDRLAAHIERLVREQEPTVVFLGSDNVGRVVTPLTSVGVHVAGDEEYDVYVVRQSEQPRLEALLEQVDGDGSVGDGT